VLADIYGSAKPWTDADSSQSPEPVRGWRVR
jgi:hypothetical protein